MAKSRPPRLSILIVSYNTRDLTLACLDSIVRETRVPHDIIVVDNASTDGSREAIMNHPSRPNLIALGENIGFARANNIAARAATAEMLLLLNPDTEVLDGAIDKLIGFAARRPQAQVWGGRTIFADGALNLASAWGRMTPWRLVCRATGLTGLFPRQALFNGEAYGGWLRDTERRVDIVSGCFLLIERALWDKLGGFDPDFFMYGEEADLCLRAARHGANPLITPAATIVHHGSASERAREDKLVKLLAAKAMLIERHFCVGTRNLGRVLHAAWPLTRMIANEIRSRWSARARDEEAALVWRQVWQRRDEWLDGYPSAPPLQSASVVTAGRRA